MGIRPHEAPAAPSPHRLGVPDLSGGWVYPHCAKRVPTNYGPMHTDGCPLPLDHDGECIPTSDELLSAGVQLWPCVTL